MAFDGPVVDILGGLGLFSGQAFEDDASVIVGLFRHGVSATRVGQGLLETEHTALGRRCCEFVPDRLRPSFFREEAGGLANQTGGPDLGRDLRDEYILRCERV